MGREGYRFGECFGGSLDKISCEVGFESGGEKEIEDDLQGFGLSSSRQTVGRLS